MSELLKLIDGTIIRVIGEVEIVGQEELQAIHADLLRAVDNVNQLIEQPEQEAVPAEDVPAAPEQPAVVEAPVLPVADASTITEAPVQPEQPVAPELPVEQPAVPAPEVTLSAPDAPVIQ